MARETIDRTPWLVGPRQFIPTAPRLVVLPHAGGGPAFYRSLTQVLEPELACWVVHYPGRERRIADPLPASLEELADTVAAEISQRIEAPLVLFGHSLGAAVAHEVALRIPENILGLIISGRGARTVVKREQAVHLLSDEALIEEVCDMNATPSEVLAHPELRSLLLPAIRSDYRIVETHTNDDLTILDIPIITYVGADDPVTAPDEMDSWAGRTRHLMRQRVFPGDHFYFASNLEAVTQAIIHDVSAMME